MNWLSSEQIPHPTNIQTPKNPYFAGVCAYALYTGDLEMVNFMLKKPYCSVYDIVDSADVPPLEGVNKKSHLFYFINYEDVYNLIQTMEILQSYLKPHDEEQILTDWFKLIYSDDKNYELKDEYIEVAEWFMKQGLDIELDRNMQKYIVEFAASKIPELYLIFMIPTKLRENQIHILHDDNIDF